MPEHHGKPPVPAHSKPKPRNSGAALALAAALIWTACVLVYFRSPDIMPYLKHHYAQIARGVYEWASSTRMKRIPADDGPKRRNDDVPIPADIRKLPGIVGWGSVPSMHQVMTTDGGRLRPLIERYVAADPGDAQEMVWDIILAWTGMTDVDPASYPRYKGDARKLFAMEALTEVKFGTNPDGSFTTPYLGPRDHATLEKYYEEWGDKVNSCLLLSSHYRPLYRLALRGNAECRTSDAKSAYTPLMHELRRIFETDGEKGRFIVVDFIRQLQVYDRRGITSANNLKDAFHDPESDDEFIRELSAGFTK